jgi:hypothetical protein
MYIEQQKFIKFLKIYQDQLTTDKNEAKQSLPLINSKLNQLSNEAGTHHSSLLKTSYQKRVENLQYEKISIKNKITRINKIQSKILATLNTF